MDIRDVITCFKFGDDRFRGLALAEGQILPFPIDFDGRPYNTLTLPCERVILTLLRRTEAAKHQRVRQAVRSILISLLPNVQPSISDVVVV